MRRRTISGKTNLVVTLSEYSYAATPAYVSRNVYVYYGGVPVTDMTSSMFTRTGSMLTPTIDNTNGKITVKVSSNTSTSSSKTSTLTFTYQGQSVTYTVTQPQDYAVSSSTGSTITERYFPSGTITSTLTLIDNGDGTSTSTSDISQTYTYRTYQVVTTTYASGNTTSSQNTITLKYRTATIPKAKLIFDQSKPYYRCCKTFSEVDAGDYSYRCATSYAMVSGDNVRTNFEIFLDNSDYICSITPTSWSSPYTSVPIKISRYLETY